MNKILVWLAVLLGICFVGAGIYYWLTPAGSLQSFVPGFEAGSTHVHFKHGLASLILAAGLFIYAWFKSAPKEAAVDVADGFPPASTGS